MNHSIGIKTLVAVSALFVGGCVTDQYPLVSPEEKKIIQASQTNTQLPSGLLASSGKLTIDEQRNEEISETYYFEQNEAKLSNEQKRKVKELIASVIDLRDPKILVEASSSTDEGAEVLKDPFLIKEEQYTLSVLRTMEAIDALSAASIAPYSIETKAYGAEKLDVLGDNVYAHAKNRFVRITISGTK